MADFKDKFITNFISEDRWKYILDGLGVTLQVTFFAVLMGIVLGLLIAIILMLSSSEIIIALSFCEVANSGLIMCLSTIENFSFSGTSAIFINLSDAIRIMGSNGMYVVDSKIKDNIDKFTTDFYNKNPKEIEKIDLNSGKVSGLGFNLSLIYLLTTISLITSLILILYYYIENEKRKIAIKKLCGFTNKALAKELIKKQFILVFIGFIIGCILFLVFKEKFEIRDVKVSNMIIAYILVLICNFFTLVLPVKRILTIDMSILLK